MASSATNCRDWGGEGREGRETGDGGRGSGRKILVGRDSYLLVKTLKMQNHTR